MILYVYYDSNEVLEIKKRTMSNKYIKVKSNINLSFNELSRVRNHLTLSNGELFLNGYLNVDNKHVLEKTSDTTFYIRYNYVISDDDIWFIPKNPNNIDSIFELVNGEFYIKKANIGLLEGYDDRIKTI